MSSQGSIHVRTLSPFRVNFNSLTQSEFLNRLYLLDVIVKINDSERDDVIVSMKLTVLMERVYKQQVSERWN